MAANFNFSNQWCLASYPVTALRIIILMRSFFGKDEKIPNPRGWKNEQKKGVCKNYSKTLVGEKQATRLSAMPQISDVDLLIDHFSGLRTKDLYPWTICPLYTVGAIIYLHRQTYFIDIYESMTDGEKISMSQFRRLAAAIIYNDFKKDGETLSTLPGIDSGSLRGLMERLNGKRALREMRSLLLNPKDYQLEEASGETLEKMRFFFELHLTKELKNVKKQSLLKIIHQYKRMDQEKNERDVEEEEEKEVPREDSGIEVPSPSASPKRRRHDDGDSEEEETAKRQRLDVDPTHKVQASTPGKSSTQPKSQETSAEDTTSSSSESSESSSSHPSSPEIQRGRVGRKAVRRLSSSSSSLSPRSSVSSSSSFSSSSSSPPLTPWLPSSSLSSSTPLPSPRVTRSTRSSAQEKFQRTEVKKMGKTQKVITGRVAKKTSDKALDKQALEIAANLGLRPKPTPQRPSAVGSATVPDIEEEPVAGPSGLSSRAQEKMQQPLTKTNHLNLDSTSVMGTEPKITVEKIREEAGVEESNESVPLEPMVEPMTEHEIDSAAEIEGTKEAGVTRLSNFTLIQTTTVTTETPAAIIESSAKAQAPKPSDSTPLETVMKATETSAAIVESFEESQVPDPSDSTLVETATAATETSAAIVENVEKAQVSDPSDSTPLEATTLTTEAAVEVKGTKEAHVAGQSDSTTAETATVLAQPATIIKNVEEAEATGPRDSTADKTTALVAEPVTAVVQSNEEMQAVVSQLSNVHSEHQELSFSERDWPVSSPSLEAEQIQRQEQTAKIDSTLDSSATMDGSTRISKDTRNEELEAVTNERPMRQYPPSRKRKVAKSVVLSMIAMDWKSDDGETDETAPQNQIDIDDSNQQSDTLIDLESLMMASFGGNAGYDHYTQLARAGLREPLELMEESNTD